MQLLPIIAIIFLRNHLLLLAIIAPSPKTLIIAIIRKLLLQSIVKATNYMNYWHWMHYCYYMLLFILLQLINLLRPNYFMIAINCNYMYLLQSTWNTFIAIHYSYSTHKISTDVMLARFQFGRHLPDTCVKHPVSARPVPQPVMRLPSH